MIRSRFIAALFGLLALGFVTDARAQNVICPTPPLGTNDNECASTAFVQAAIASISANNPEFQIFLSPGAVTTLTLTTTPLPVSSGFVTIAFDGSLQPRDTWSINTTTGVITFNSAIPAETRSVEVDWFAPTAQAGVLSITAGASSLSGAVALVAGGNITLTPSGQNITIAAASYLLGIGNTLSSGTPNGLLFDNGGVLGNLATCNNGIIATNGSGVPSCGTSLPTGLSLPNALYTHLTIYQAAGSPHTWVVPAGVTSIIVDAVAGGSGSSGVGYGNPCLVIGNSGENGGYVTDDVIAVTPGDTLSISPGTGGAAGTNLGAAGCQNAGPSSGAGLGGAGGNTTIVDTTTSTTLLSLTGGASIGSTGLAPPSSSVCSTGGCFAHYEFGDGQFGWAMNAGNAQAFGSYYMPTSHFPYSPNTNAYAFSDAAAFIHGNCLGAQPGGFYGQGASSSVSIDSPAPGCGGNQGIAGVVIIRY